MNFFLWLDQLGCFSENVFFQIKSYNSLEKKNLCENVLISCCKTKINLRVLIQFIKRFLAVFLKFSAISFLFARHLSSDVFRHFVPVGRARGSAEDMRDMSDMSDISDMSDMSEMSEMSDMSAMSAMRALSSAIFNS